MGSLPSTPSLRRHIQQARACAGPSGLLAVPWLASQPPRQLPPLFLAGIIIFMSVLLSIGVRESALFITSKWLPGCRLHGSPPPASLRCCAQPPMCGAVLALPRPLAWQAGAPAHPWPRARARLHTHAVRCVPAAPCRCHNSQDCPHCLCGNRGLNARHHGHPVRPARRALCLQPRVWGSQPRLRLHPAHQGPHPPLLPPGRYRCCSACSAAALPAGWGGMGGEVGVGWGEWAAPSLDDWGGTAACGRPAMAPAAPLQLLPPCPPCTACRVTGATASSWLPPSCSSVMWATMRSATPLKRYA